MLQLLSMNEVVLPELAPVMFTEKWTPWVPQSDGTAIRVRMHDDPDASLTNDGDWFGKVEWVYDKPSPSRRPKGYDGAARVVARDGRSKLWWQPPEGLDAKQRDECFDRVCEYYNNQWSYIGVEVEWRGAPCECCGLQHVGSDALWGIESDLDKAYAREVITECAWEAREELRRRAPQHHKLPWRHVAVRFVTAQHPHLMPRRVK